VSGSPSEPAVTPLEVRGVDPFDDDALAAWYATYAAADRHGRPHATPYHLPELRAAFRTPQPGTAYELWAGWVGDRLVSCAYLELPLLDNTGQAELVLSTHPDHRRRGHGSALLEHVLARAADRGRTVVVVRVAYPYDAPPDGAGHPDAEFVTRRGFTFGLGDVQRVLDLPVDPALLESLVREAERHHAGYRFEQFTGRVPEDLLEGYGALLGAVVTEAPVGELDYEPEQYPPERIRADDDALEEAARVRHATVALDGSGACVGYNEVVVAGHEDGRAFQWGTLVLPAHRGHRLGLALKARTLQLLATERPGLRQVVTFNAEVNAPMIGINERLGFRPVERLGEFQRRL
jgi:GNAT superfamily N-acetyltransferase